MATATDRTAKLHEIARRGIPVPNTAYADAERTVPTAPTRAWQWHAAVWPRPSATGWRGHPEELHAAQREWDDGHDFTVAQERARAEIEARRQAEQAERDAAAAAQRTAEAEQLKAELRARYLSMPGTTAEEFEREYPALLADHRRRQMAEQDAATDVAREATRQRVRNAL